MSTRILVVEHQPVVRQTLRSLLERDGFSVVGDVGDITEAHIVARDLSVDVVVLDLIKPVSRCLDAIRDIIGTDLKLKGLVLLAFEDYLVGGAFEAGARGYVLKTRVAEDLPSAIRAVAEGGVYLSPGISLAMVEMWLTMASDPPDPPSRASSLLERKKTRATA